jgi:hypothetical protein
MLETLSYLSAFLIERFFRFSFNFFFGGRFIGDLYFLITSELTLEVEF